MLPSKTLTNKMQQDGNADRSRGSFKLSEYRLSKNKRKSVQKAKGGKRISAQLLKWY